MIRNTEAQLRAVVYTTRSVMNFIVIPNIQTLQ